jgi:hypothetical protein
LQVLGQLGDVAVERAQLEEHSLLSVCRTDGRESDGLIGLVFEDPSFDLVRTRLDESILAGTPAQTTPPPMRRISPMRAVGSSRLVVGFTVGHPACGYPALRRPMVERSIVARLGIFRSSEAVE